jgi:hypothetical protein
VALEIPAKIMLASTFTWASPPRMLPMIASAKSKIRFVTPNAFMRLAARIKNGTASSTVLLTLADMNCGIDRMS